ncbi:TPA: ISLre2 family transposase, partial [Bacillus anthracis]|nr:ISLre2 family transposase [Bacillus anthracis]
MTIVTEIGKILKTSKHLSELETEMISLMSKVFTESLAHCLERLDTEFVSDYLEDGWEID